MVVLLGLTAFFVASEFAVVAIDRSRLEVLADEGRRGAATALVIHRRLSFHLSGAQLGLTLASLVLGFVAEPSLARVIEPALDSVMDQTAARAVSVAIALALASGGSMVIGELIPKNLVLARPERTALALARPLRVFSLTLGPFIRLSNGAANWVVRRFKVEPQEELASARSIEDLGLLIQASEASGTLAHDQADLLARTLRFEEKTAADALVPRTEILTLSGDATLEDLRREAVRTGSSRFPVVGRDLDDILGVVHVKDLYGVPVAERGTTAVSKVMTPAMVVPETVPLGDLLGDMQRRASHLAVVFDEHGGTAGILTLEDLLEEIVGEIDDEHDLPTTNSRYDDVTGTWVLLGSLHPDEVTDACGAELAPGPYDTLAGFLLWRLGHVPESGESVSEDGWTFTVRGLDGRRIASVIVGPPARTEANPASSAGPGAGRAARGHDRNGGTA